MTVVQTRNGWQGTRHELKSMGFRDVEILDDPATRECFAHGHPAVPVQLLVNNEDFSKQPVSLADRRSDRTGDGKDWTPRDVLLRLLREIDAGDLRNVTGLVVVYQTEPEPGGEDYGTAQACGSVSQALGLLAMGHVLIPARRPA